MRKKITVIILDTVSMRSPLFEYQSLIRFTDESKRRSRIKCIGNQSN